VDYPNDPQEEEEIEETNIKANFDEMHPDKIAGLAQKRNANLNQDKLRKYKMKIHRNKSFPLVVNKNLRPRLCSKKKRGMMLKMINILKTVV
jgi:hypothetical protein